MNVNKEYGYLALILQAVIKKFTTIENKVSPQPLGVDLQQNKSAGRAVTARGKQRPEGVQAVIHSGREKAKLQCL